jgi:hypothetical protein
MNESVTVDVIFIKLVESIRGSKNTFDLHFDSLSSPLWNFYDLLSQDKPLTKNQADYILKILKNYKNDLATLGYDIDEIIRNPKWKHEFRVIDQTKKISVEQDDEGIIWYCFQFPYSFKETFDTSFDLKNVKYHLSKWDPDKKLRKIRLYYLDFLKVDNFINQYGFKIDESYLEIKAQIEEIILSQETVEKTSQIIDNQVQLVNASPEAQEYFQVSKSQIIENDLMLAKSLGHIYETHKPRNLFEKISSSQSTDFWTKDLSTFIEIYKKIKGKVCIILNDDVGYKKWLSDFLAITDSHFISRSEIKVCFREDKTSELNKWIKDNGIGGKVSEGNIYIFKNSPAKWLYEDINSVKMLVMTDIIPSPNRYVQHLVTCHPLVLYVNNNKPTSLREMKIVNL